jgi:lipoyl(octanoyl) transferase
MRFLNHVSGVRELVRSLEEVFIQLLEEDFQIKAGRDSEHPGVWVGNDKITAIGLLIRSGITMHGFAFNVNTDLAAFNWILSCGITGKGVTSLQRLTGKEQDIELLKRKVVQYFGQVFHLETCWADRQELKNSLGW